MEENAGNTERTITPEQLYAIAAKSDKERYLCLLNGYPAYTNGTMDKVIRSRWETIHSCLAKDICVHDNGAIEFKYDGDMHELRIQRLTDLDPVELLSGNEVEVEYAAGK